jgi:hypothetical protein
MLEFPFMSVTVTETGYVPAAFGVQVKLDVFPGEHPDPEGRPDQTYVYGGVPPLADSENIAGEPARSGFGMAVGVAALMVESACKPLRRDRGVEPLASEVREPSEVSSLGANARSSKASTTTEATRAILCPEPVGKNRPVLGTGEIPGRVVRLSPDDDSIPDTFRLCITSKPWPPGGPLRGAGR